MRGLITTSVSGPVSGLANSRFAISSGGPSVSVGGRHCGLGDSGAVRLNGAAIGLRAGRLEAITPVYFSTAAFAAGAASAAIGRGESCSGVFAEAIYAAMACLSCIRRAAFAASSRPVVSSPCWSAVWFLEIREGNTRGNKRRLAQHLVKFGQAMAVQLSELVKVQLRRLLWRVVFVVLLPLVVVKPLYQGRREKMRKRLVLWVVVGAMPQGVLLDAARRLLPPGLWAKKWSQLAAIGLLVSVLLQLVVQTAAMVVELAAVDIAKTVPTPPVQFLAVLLVRLLPRPLAVKKAQHVAERLQCQKLVIAAARGQSLLRH